MSRIKGSSGLLFMMITPSAPPACAAKALSEKAHPPPRSTATIAPIAVKARKQLLRQSTTGQSSPCNMPFSAATLNHQWPRWHSHGA